MCKTCSHQHATPGTAKLATCERPATVERDGKPYCKLHDPEAVAARREAKYQAWKKRKGL